MKFKTSVKTLALGRLESHDEGWGVPSDKTMYSEVLCHSRYCAIKIPPCSKVISAEKIPIFCNLSPALVKSSYKRNSLEPDEKKNLFLSSSDYISFYIYVSLLTYSLPSHCSSLFFSLLLSLTLLFLHSLFLTLSFSH